LPDGPQSKSQSGRALRGAAWFGLGTVVEYTLTFVTMVWLARLISPAEFGVASLAISFLTFARLFSEVAMGPALIRRESVDAMHIDVAFISVMTLAGLASAATLLAAPAIATFFAAPQLRSICRAIAVLIPIHAAISIATAILSRRCAFRYMALSTLPGLILGYAGTSIFLAMRGYGAWSIMLGAIVQYALTLLLLLIQARYVPRLRWSSEVFKELLSFSVWQSASQVINQLALSGDNFVVGRSLGMAPLGSYGRAYKLMEIPVNVISTTVFKAAFPLMAKIQAEKERLTAAYLTSLGGLLTLLIPLSAFLVFTARPLIWLVLGSKWDAAVAPFQILCVSLTFRAAYRHVNLPALVLGHTVRLTVLSALYALWVVSGSVIAVMAVGTTEAVATGVSLAIFIHYATSAVLANRLLKIRLAEFAQLHVPGLFAGFIVGGFVFLAQALPWHDRGPLLTLVTDATVAALAITVCLYLWPRLFLGVRNLTLLTRVSHRVPVGRRSFETWLARACAPM
jgi:O-antigen/teichoic acid export membrane protein